MTSTAATVDNAHIAKTKTLNLPQVETNNITEQTKYTE